MIAALVALWLIVGFGTAVRLHCPDDGPGEVLALVLFGPIVVAMWTVVWLLEED